MNDLIPEQEDASYELEVDTIPYRECKERILMSLIRAAEKERDPFLKEGNKVNVYAYGGKDDIASHLDSIVPHKPTMTKASQFIDVIGSTLLEQNPTRRVEPRPFSPPESFPRAQRMEQYLNYIPRETDLKLHQKRGVTQSCIFGKGVVWTGWDKEKNIVTSIFDTVENLISDPDARFKEECNWKGRIRRKPRWFLKNIYPDAKLIIDETTPDGKQKSSKKGANFTTDMLKYYEIYLKIGLHNYDGGEELLAKQGDSDEVEGDDTPRKYIITNDGKLLSEGAWEVPIYKKKLWPCQELDFKEVPGQYWPKSPLWAGISQLENMNWLYRHMMARVRASARAFLVIMSQNGAGPDEDAIDILLDQQSTPDGIWDLIPINATGLREGAKVQEIIQQLKLESNIDEFLKAISFEEAEFEKATGLYGILFQGQPENQMRSAAEVQFREKNSRSRIEEMRTCVEDWSNEIATVQALYARFLSTEEDFAAILGPEGAQQIGVLIPSFEEETERMTGDLIEQGAPPEIATQLAGMQAQIQDEELRMQGGLTFDEYIKETEYSIAGGSTRRKDVDEEKQVYADASNQMVPTLVKSGLPPLMAIGLRIEREKYALAGASQEMLNNIDQAIQIIAMLPPPPPPAPPGGGGPQPGANPPSPPPGV